MSAPVATNNRARRVPKATVDLALRWLKGEATTGEATMKLRKKKRAVANTVYCMGIALRQAYSDKLLEIPEQR